MGLLSQVALTVLGITFLTFTALFGRLPVFRWVGYLLFFVEFETVLMGSNRRTPIGFLHRAMWIYIPNGLVRLDSLLLGGRALYCWNRSGRYLMHENHPLVLVSGFAST
jgi:palmitoyltransferase